MNRHLRINKTRIEGFWDVIGLLQIDKEDNWFMMRAIRSSRTLSMSLETMKSVR
jgi:hypothetical protein